MTSIIKRYSIIAILLFIYQAQVVQAMEENEGTETEIAEEEENKNGQYVNLEKLLIYKPKKYSKEKDRTHKKAP